MWNDPTFWIILILQSGEQAFFLSRYFGQAKGRNKRMVWLTLFLVFILGPVCLMIPVHLSLLRSLFNLAVIGGICILLNRGGARSRIWSGLALWWFPMPICEALCQMITLAIFGEIPMEHKVFQYNQYTRLLFGFQFLCTILMFFVYAAELRLFKKRQADEDSEVTLIYSTLILSAGVTAFYTMSCWFLEPELTLNTALIIPLSFFLLLHLVLFTALRSLFKKRSARQAQFLISGQYALQLEELLVHNDQENRLRKLRHDLLNWMEVAESKGENPC